MHVGAALSYYDAPLLAMGQGVLQPGGMHQNPQEMARLALSNMERAIPRLKFSKPLRDFSSRRLVSYSARIADRLRPPSIQERAVEVLGAGRLLKSNLQISVCYRKRTGRT